MPTTVEQLYTHTKQLMFEKPSSQIYDDYLIGNLNRLLVELFNENNFCRMFKGKTPLEEPQQVGDRTAELIYEDEYVLNVLPLGLAARFLIDDDLQKYSIFSTDYNNARVIAQKMISKDRINAITSGTAV